MSFADFYNKIKLSDNIYIIDWDALSVIATIGAALVALFLGLLGIWYPYLSKILYFRSRIEPEIYSNFLETYIKDMNDYRLNIKDHASLMNYYQQNVGKKIGNKDYNQSCDFSSYSQEKEFLEYLKRRGIITFISSYDYIRHNEYAIPQGSYTLTPSLETWTKIKKRYIKNNKDSKRRGFLITLINKLKKIIEIF